MKSGIYKITNIINGKCYIGSAINIENRWKTHLRDLTRNKANPKFQNAWNKYGESSFIFKVILYCEKEILIHQEQLWIDFYEAYTEKGYNISPTAGSSLGVICSEETKKKIAGSNKGRKHSEETKQKMSKMRKGHRGWNKGRICSEENIQKLVNAGKGRIFSKETRQKISDAHKGKICGIHTEESFIKISKANKGKLPWNTGLTKETDERLIKMSESLKGKKASEETKQKMSKAHKNRGPMTEETKQKLSKSNVGKVRSEETKQKMRHPKRKRNCSPDSAIPDFPKMNFKDVIL
jgi:group I intron endonuclease